MTTRTPLTQKIIFKRTLALLPLLCWLLLTACGTAVNQATPIPPTFTLPPFLPPTFPSTFAPATLVPTTSAPTTAPVGGGDTPWLKVYFTNPNPPDQQNNGIDQYVVPLLNAATRTIDIASFDFTLPSVTNALIAAKRRGVQVRMVLDEKNGQQQLKASEAANIQPLDALQTLTDAGIPVVDGGRSNGLMHNKMIIIDGATLFMGSWNMSYNDTFRNNNNLLQITSQKLIANYQAKFNELFVDKHFGTKALVKALTPKLTLDGTEVENYFSPPDNVMQKLVTEVNGAQTSVKFMIFTYTHADLSAAMIARARAGVKVEGVIENRGASQGAFVPLFCAGIPVKLDGNKYTMHDKVIIIDDKTVITGSFNFTVTADNANDDNVLIIHNPAVAAQYLQEYARIYGAGKVSTDTTCK